MNTHTLLHTIAASLNIEVGTAARIIINGKAPKVWGRRHAGKVKALLAQSTPRLEKQAAFINSRQFAL